MLLLHGGPGVSDYTDSLAAELEDGDTVTRYQQRGVAPSPFDGGTEEMGAIMEERVGPGQAARAEELDARAMSPEGSHDDAVEAFRIMWPGYFASPDKALPMPPFRISLQCNDETFEHFRARRPHEGRHAPATLMAWPGRDQVIRGRFAMRPRGCRRPPETGRLR